MVTEVFVSLERNFPFVSSNSLRSFPCNIYIEQDHFSFSLKEYASVFVALAQFHRRVEPVIAPLLLWNSSHFSNT